MPISHLSNVIRLTNKNMRHENKTTAQTFCNISLHEISKVLTLLLVYFSYLNLFTLFFLQSFPWEAYHIDCTFPQPRSTGGWFGYLVTHKWHNWLGSAWYSKQDKSKCCPYQDRALYWWRGCWSSWRQETDWTAQFEGQNGESVIFCWTDKRITLLKLLYCDYFFNVLLIYLFLLFINNALMLPIPILRFWNKNVSLLNCFYTAYHSQADPGECQYALESRQLIWLIHWLSW